MGRCKRQAGRRWLRSVSEAYPDSPHAAEARATLSELRWRSAVSTNTIVAYADYARVANAKGQTARAREAVRSLASNAPKPKPGQVQIQGVFADNMIKFVDSIDVAYNGTIAGYAAKIRYTVQVAKNAQGQQLNFMFKDRGETLEMSSPATVTGTIELMAQDNPVKFDLSRIALGPQPNLVGSFLVARHPPMLWSGVAGLELLDAKHDCRHGETGGRRSRAVRGSAGLFGDVRSLNDGLALTCMDQLGFGGCMTTKSAKELSGDFTNSS